ncbi:O-antigen/teichoic acid export membrane protein [Paucibacter oligotrophus]|uniref:O-antigen/teichoic acid export membrane protein n=1 Tax=Roseateles oligotrophus TaxID=1769250 RepID=A0A840L822_9BURK|nr:hypothetical protein [Roseateles oligotrophus]MBB4842299.1 O-antigen/teichoic acid export membrane protein [Roseateles oligotrophus]
MTVAEGAYSRQRTIRNAKIFVLGKACSAALNVFWLGLLVRLLDLGDYAVYVAAIATLEAGIALSSFGVEWLLLRYVPEYVVHGDGGRLKRFIGLAVVVRIAATCLAVALGMAVLHFRHQPALVFQAGVGPLLAVLLLSEASMRLLRENALESMGRQGFTQLGVMLRTGLMLVAALWFSRHENTLAVQTLLTIEVVVSLITLAYAGIVVAIAVRDVGGQRAVSIEWRPPAFREAFKAGWNNYLSSLMSFPLTLQALLLMVSSIGSPTVVASFGFIVRLVEIMRGYLPGMMLMNVLRPRFVGMFARFKDFVPVAREAALASRLSALTVAPLVGITALYGDTLLSLASGGKITSGRWVLAAFTMTLIVRVHRQISVVLVNCVELSGLLLRAGLCALVVLPLSWWSAYQGWAVWGAFAVVVWDECVWVLTMVLGLRRAGYAWQGEWLFMFKLLGCAMLSAVLVAQLPFETAMSDVLYGSLLLLLCFVILVLTTRSFRLRELDVLRGK